VGVMVLHCVCISHSFPLPTYIHGMLRLVTNRISSIIGYRNLRLFLEGHLEDGTSMKSQINRSQNNIKKTRTKRERKQTQNAEQSDEGMKRRGRSRVHGRVRLPLAAR
jgi:hypothetical protein